MKKKLCQGFCALTPFILAQQSKKSRETQLRGTIVANQASRGGRCQKGNQGDTAARDRVSKRRFSSLNKYGGRVGHVEPRSMTTKTTVSSPDPDSECDLHCALLSSRFKLGYTPFYFLSTQKQRVGHSLIIQTYCSAPSIRSAMSPSYVYPSCIKCFGYMLILVNPGSVFTSFT